jgi:ketosteroid isomerase-like protein
LKSRSKWGCFALLLILPLRVLSQQSDVLAIQQLEENYIRAEIEDDSAIASNVLADDFVGLRADGKTSTKADILSSLARHERRRDPYQVTATDMREHLFGDTACVTYTKVYTRVGSQAMFSENVLHVLTKRNGVWHLQLSSPVPSSSRK